MNKKFWSVKGFILENDEKKIVINRNGKGEITGEINYYIRKFTVLAKNLTFEKAKEIRDQYKAFGATIFPDVKEEELKIIELS